MNSNTISVLDKRYQVYTMNVAVIFSLSKGILVSIKVEVHLIQMPFVNISKIHDNYKRKLLATTMARTLGPRPPYTLC